jgi:hypothetical protein
MSDIFMPDPEEDEFDLTPRPASRSAASNVGFRTPRSASDMTSEGFGGGFGDLDAVEYGKPTTAGQSRSMDVTDEMDVSEDDGCDKLFFLAEQVEDGRLADTVCCGVISSGQGIRRFCTLPRIEGEPTCGVSSHSVKAVLERNSFYVQTKVKGGSGALTSKTIKVTDMRPEDKAYFQERRFTPAEWECRFDQAKLAMFGNGAPLSKLLWSGQEVALDLETTVLDFGPTPKKPRTQEPLDGAASPSGWVELPEPDLKLQDIRPSTQDSPDRKSKNLEAIGHNFTVLRRGLPLMVENSAASFSELREQFDKLATAMQKVDRKLGRPEGFGTMASVTSAFDGLRYLHEIGEERNEKFVQYPYESLIKELKLMDSQISHLQTVDRWSDEATDLRKMNAGLAQSVSDLKNKTVSGLVKFYHKFTTTHGIPGDILSNDLSRLQTSVTALEAGSSRIGINPRSLQQPPAQVGFDVHGNQLGSSAQLANILTRLAQAEADNARLARELQSLKATPPAQPSAASNPNEAFDIKNRLTALEAAGDLESVTIGSFTFKNIQDCETFLYQHVPHDVLDCYCYDMISMIHRLGKDPSSGAVQREHTAIKAGFKTSGSATMFSSFQQILPGPFGTAATTSSSSGLPIPALKDFPTWDRQDGMTGLKTEVTQGITAASTSISAAMNRDCENHPVAKLVFSIMIQNGQLQWHQVATYISERYMTSVHQIDDIKEAWLFASEIFKGIFTECYKVRVVAADRTSAIHGHKDAARSMWVALQTQQLMSQLIALKFTGHPQLSPYSINHLFRHRVSPKAVETMTTKVAKVENDLRGVTALQQKMKVKYPL